MLSTEESEMQEGEADDLAYTWFNQHVEQENNPFLPLLTTEEIRKVQEKNQILMKEKLNVV